MTISTREEVVKVAARLFVLGGACSCLSLPLKLAASWLPPGDAAAFADRAEEHVRALLGLYDEYLAAAPGALERCGGDRTDQVIELEIADVRKEISRLAKIADGSADLDIGPNYLPPEFRTPNGRPDLDGYWPHRDESADPGESEL
jgi:hypothetical protein